jgi:hypothetical protein
LRARGAVTASRVHELYAFVPFETRIGGLARPQHTHIIIPKKIHQTRTKYVVCGVAAVTL